MLTHTPSTLIGRRYLVHSVLGKGGMGMVYRAVDRLTDQQVAIKRVLAPTEQLIFASRSDSTDLRLALAQEFRLLASLRHPNIISVIDYGFDQERQPYIALELIDHAQTILDAGRVQSRENQVNLLIQILHALAYLHRRGILHRDLKPTNVLVSNGQVKVLDFGLSVLHGQANTHEISTGGTLAYMAPEVLAEQPISEATDLYALGVIAYEIFANRHPFNTETITSLTHDILHTIPAMDFSGLDESIKAIIERLLNKLPENRYSSADEVIAALYKAINQPQPPELAEIRESYLQAAQLVGRDEELAQLSGVLKNAINGQGSAWLIGGESGVGKSRLLNEVRTLGLVGGALVLRGQAISEVGSPYQMWRDALRWLALITPLSDIEAGVLKVLVPDVGALVQRDVPDAPPLNPMETQIRLMSTIEAIFRRQTQPIVLILEDLHWADSESIALLQRLSRITPELALLLIGSYRDDEQPDLPSRLADMKHMPLQRLSADGIAQLSESMLGRVGREPQVIDLLQRETEGNIFFVVEVVRTLAEEAGNLEQIARLTLPQHIFAGGMQRIVQRRLSRISDDDCPLLRLAAIAGRQLDLDLLKALRPDMDLQKWLVNCSNASVLEVQEDQWRFAHDKLREGVLADLTADAQQERHLAVAQAMEPLYAHDAKQIPTLAYHFLKSQQWEKALKYLLEAGDSAALLYAHAKARTHYAQALEALTHLPDTVDYRRARIETTIKYVSVSFAADDPIQNVVRLQDMEKLAKALPEEQPGSNDLLIARVQFWIGRCYYYGNQLPEAIGYFRQVLAASQKHQDQELIGLPSSVIGRVLTIQGRYMQGHALVTQADGLLEKAANWNEWVWTKGFVGITTGAVTGDYAKAIAESEKSLARALETKYLTSVGASHIIRFFIYSLGRDAKQMLLEAEDALDATTQADDTLYKYISYALKAWAEGLLGQHAAAAADMAESKKIAQQLGGRLILADLLSAGHAEIVYCSGNMPEAIRLAEESVKIAKAIGGLYGEGLAQRVWGSALVDLEPPKWAEADEHFAISLENFEAGPNVLEIAHTHVMWGHASLKRGDLRKARDHFEKAIHQYRTSNIPDLVQSTQEWLDKTTGQSR